MVPLIIVEVTLASFTLVRPLGLAWWAPLGALVAMVAVTVALTRLVRGRTAGWRTGLSVLGDGAACTRMAAFVGLAVCGQIVRNWLMLQASGIHASIFDATAVVIAVAGPGIASRSALPQSRLFWGADLEPRTAAWETPVNSREQACRDPGGRRGVIAGGLERAHG